MVAIEFEDVFGPCVVTALSAYQMGVFQRKVGKARKKFKVTPPTTLGESVDEGFIRVFRAHQNCVETYTVFLGSLWSCSLLWHQVPASLVGIVYMFGRAKYFRDYSIAADRRMSGFKLSIGSIAVLGIGSMVGCGLKLFRYFKK